MSEEKNPIRIGLIAHTAVLHRLIALGFEVLQPLSDDLRYDLAYFAKAENKLVRVQCKAGRYDSRIGCILFKNFNRTGGRAVKRGYVGEAEYFGVYCSEFNKTYLIPVNLVPYTGEVHLRVIPSKNNQLKKVIWAQDYEI